MTKHDLQNNLTAVAATLESVQATLSMAISQCESAIYDHLASLEDATDGCNGSCLSVSPTGGSSAKGVSSPHPLEQFADPAQAVANLN